MREKPVVVAAIQMYRKRLTRNLQLCCLKGTLRIYERSKESELIKQNQLYQKPSDEIKNLKMENLEAMIESENTKEEIEQWTENQLKRSRTESLR